MSQILPLYSEIWKNYGDDKNQKGRFVDEVFEQEVYGDCRPRLTVVDIGAYEGEFGFYCLPFADKIYACEPDPRPYGVMVERISRFNLSDKILTFPLAIGNTNGPRKMALTHYGGSAFSTEGEGNVICKTLNQFLLDNDIKKVDILKMDTEGAEGEIFRTPDWREAIPKVSMVVAEVHGDDNFVRVMTDCGFKSRVHPQFHTWTFWREE